MFAVTGMLDPATPQGQAPVTAGLLNAARQTMANLAVGGTTAATTHAALLALDRADGIQAPPFSAVPVSELDLYQRNLGADGDAKPLNVLDEVRLSGPTRYLDFPYTPLGPTPTDAPAISCWWRRGHRPVSRPSDRPAVYRATP